MKSMYAAYSSINSLDEGMALSLKERSQNSLNAAVLTYGEIEFVHFLPLLCSVTPHSPALIFWDLGCGTGKGLITAALSDRFAAVYGVELLKSLAEAGVRAVEAYHKLAGERSLPDPAMRVWEGDLEKVDWVKGDVVYMASVYFPAELLKRISAAGRGMKKGAKIVTLKMLPDTEGAFRLENVYRVKMTWGLCDVFVIERL